MPMSGDIMGGFGGSAEVDIRWTNPDIGGAIELASRINGKISLENYFAPGTGAGCGRSISETLRIKIGEFELLVKSNLAWCCIGSRNDRIGKGGVRRPNLQLGGTENRKKQERGELKSEKFYDARTGHKTSGLIATPIRRVGRVYGLD